MCHTASIARSWAGSSNGACLQQSLEARWSEPYRHARAEQQAAPSVSRHTSLCVGRTLCLEGAGALEQGTLERRKRLQACPLRLILTRSLLPRSLGPAAVWRLPEPCQSPGLRPSCRRLLLRTAAAAGRLPKASLGPWLCPGCTVCQLGLCWLGWGSGSLPVGHGLSSWLARQRPAAPLQYTASQLLGQLGWHGARQPCDTSTCTLAPQSQDARCARRSRCQQL